MATGNGPVTITPDATSAAPQVTITPDSEAQAPKKYAPGYEFGQSVARGMGLDVGRIKEAEDKYGSLEGAKEVGSQMLQGLKGLLKDPTQLVTGPASNLENAIKSGSGGQILGALAGVLGGAESTDRVAIAPDAIAEGTRPTLQRALSIGPDRTARAIADRTTQVDAITAENQAILRNARSLSEADDARFQQKLAAARQANADARQSALEKQQLMGEIQGHANDLTDQLVNLKQTEIAKGKAMYPQIDGAAEPLAIRGIVQDAIEKNIKGTDKPPAMLGQMLKDLEPEDPLAQASVFRGGGAGMRQLPSRGGGTVAFGDLPPAVREKILPTLSPEERAMYQPPPPGGGIPLPFEQLHGYITELGEELSRDLSGDERAAIGQVRAGIQDVMRKMADEEGKLPQFQAAQKNWAKLENTFNKTSSDRWGVASPIAKALAAKDPVTGKVIPERVASILLKDNNYKLAQTMLGRYGQVGSDVLQLMKEKVQQMVSFPQTLKTVPEPTGPTLSKIAKLQQLPPDVDPQALKAQALREVAENLKSFRGFRAAMDIGALVHFITTGNPILLGVPVGRRLAGYGLESKLAMDYLTKPTAAEKIATSKVFARKPNVPTNTP